MWIGDFRLGDTFDLKFCTVAPTTGVPTTLAGTPVISAYPGNSTTQLTAGITLSVDFDGVTGLHNVRVVATSGNGYATATNYALVITTGTVSGSSVVGYVVGHFSIEARSALMPTTAARTLVVDAAGLADANTVKVGPTGSGTAQTAGDIMADTNDIQTRLPAALVGGRMDSSVGAMAANVLTATAINADAITAAKIADGAIDAATFAAGAINAAAIAADAITDAKVAADVTIASVTGAVGFVSGAVGSVTGAVGSVTGNVGGNVTGSVGSVVGAVGSVTGNVGGNLVGTLSATERNAIADAHLDRADGVETGLTPRQTHRLNAAALAGKLSGAATATVTIRNAVADSKARITATVDADGNRSAVTTDVT